MYGCDVCGEWTQTEPMSIDGHWYLCTKCGDYEYEENNIIKSKS